MDDGSDQLLTPNSEPGDADTTVDGHPDHRQVNQPLRFSARQMQNQGHLASVAATNQGVRSHGQATQSYMSGYAYPVSLASHSDRERNSRTNRKRAIEEADTNTVHQKPKHDSAQSRSPLEKESTGGDTSSAQVRDAQLLEESRDRFVSKWRSKVKTTEEWHGLVRFAYVGNKAEWEPFAELDIVMTRVQDFGSPEVRATFIQGVCAWIASRTGSGVVGESAPAHFERSSINGFDPNIFRRLWNAAQVVRNVKGVKVIAVVMRRKALIELSTTYTEVIHHIRAVKGTGVLKHGEVAKTKARQILYATLYPSSTEQKRMRNLFDYDIKCASPYIYLRDHYGSDGILAMIPAKIKETEFQISARFPALGESLDLFRPNFRKNFLDVYSEIIDSIFKGESVTEDTLNLLEPCGAKE